MAWANITICNGLRARLFRISFSSELAFEISVPTAYGDAFMRKIMEADEEFGVTPYGTKALGVMRVEKGHATGNELNRTTSALNLGMGRMVSETKDSIGSIMSHRNGMNITDDLIQVEVKPLDLDDAVPAGSHLMNADGPVDAAHDQGYVTSACYSPNLGHAIGLAFIKNGSNRIGEKCVLSAR